MLWHVHQILPSDSREAQLNLDFQHQVIAFMSTSGSGLTRQHIGIACLNCKTRKSKVLYTQCSILARDSLTCVVFHSVRGASLVVPAVDRTSSVCTTKHLTSVARYTGNEPKPSPPFKRNWFSACSSTSNPAVKRVDKDSRTMSVSSHWRKLLGLRIPRLLQNR